MNIVKGCKCGAELTEKNFVPPRLPAERFGLSKGTFGNTRLRFIKLKCSECGAEYIGETVPGKTGGSIRLNRIVDMGEPVEIKKPEPVLPAEPEDLEAEEGFVELDDEQPENELLEEKSMQDLRHIAKNLGFSTPVGTKKIDLIEMIQSKS